MVGQMDDLVGHVAEQQRRQVTAANVTGVMIPCHSPSQKPASSWVPASTTSFVRGVAALA